MDTSKQKAKLDKINYVFAYIIALMPLITMILNFTKIFYIRHCLVYFCFAYIIFLVFHLPYLSRLDNLKAKIKQSLRWPVILAILFALWITIISIINGSIGEDYIHYLSYFAIFMCIYRVDRKYYKPLIYTFMGVMLLSVTLSLIWPNTTAVPGFYRNSLGFSMQFGNPNFSAYVVAALLVINIGMLTTNGNKVAEVVFLSINYVMFTLFLYANGSFAPITAVYFAVVVMIVYRWIKLKHCPWQTILCLVGLVPLSFVVDIVPLWVENRNTSVNYFTECVAVFDEIFGTNILGRKIDGADGWDRGELRSNAYAAICANIYRFLFGYGAGYFANIAPHNHVLLLMLDFGFVGTAMYLVLIGYMIYTFIRQKLPESSAIMYIAFISYCFMSFFGSMSYFSYAFMVPIIAVCYSKNINKKCHNNL